MPVSSTRYEKTPFSKPDPPSMAKPAPAIMPPADWGRGFIVQPFRWKPMHAPGNVVANHNLTLHLGTPLELEYKRGGRWRTQTMEPGQINLFPAGEWREGRWTEPLQLLAIALQPDFVARAAAESLPRKPVELIPVIGAADAQIRHIGLAMQAELETILPGDTFPGDIFPGDSLLLETLAVALSVHLLRRYAAVPCPVPDLAATLSRRELRHAREYIHDNLARELSLAEIANVVGLSVHHFARLFRLSTGVSPRQYIIRERVERARQLLRRSDLAISEIALCVGFHDQAHLARHFRRQHGIAPGDFRRK